MKIKYTNIYKGLTKKEIGTQTNTTNIVPDGVKFKDQTDLAIFFIKKARQYHSKLVCNVELYFPIKMFTNTNLTFSKDFREDKTLIKIEFDNITFEHAKDSLTANRIIAFLQSLDRSLKYCFNKVSKITSNSNSITITLELKAKRNREIEMELTE